MTAKPTSESLQSLIDQGLSDAACGRQFGISKYAIRRLRRRWGIAARRPVARHQDEADPMANRWSLGDLGPSQIAALYGQSCYGPGVGRLHRPTDHKRSRNSGPHRPTGKASVDATYRHCAS